MKRILIIDDEPGITQLLETLLQEEGYEVVVAEDGSKGLDELQRKPVDLVLLDLMMPNMSGWDFLDALERTDDDGTPRVAILSAVFGDEAIERAKDHYGCQAYITKPFRIQELLDILDGLLAA